MVQNNNKPQKFDFKSLAVLLPLLIGLLMCMLVIKRELWFDEALTVMNFVLPLSLKEIYVNYTIPNNQIIYSMVLKIWDSLCIIPGDIVIFWRVLSMIFSGGFVLLIFQLRRKLDEQIYPAALTLSAVCVSTVFMNYATALRGYAASWFFIALALYGIYLIFKGQKPSNGWLIYCAAALLAVGTVPTNLLALGAVLIYAIPWMQKKFWCDKRFYLAAAIIPLALIVFYLPIAKAFLATFKLGEGFSTRFGALGMTLSMYVSCFGLLLLFAPWGISKKPWQHYLRYLIWLLPAAAIFILHKAPFPRVFVTVLPVLIMLVIDGISKVTAESWKISHKWALFMLVLCVQAMLLPGMMLLSKKCGVTPEEDDFFRAYYMFKTHRPAETADFLMQKSGHGNPVFLSFNSDPLPVIFYTAINGVDFRNYRSDIPYNSVKALPDNTLVVLNSQESAADFEKRFNGKLEKVQEIKRYTIYRFRK